MIHFWNFGILKFATLILFWAEGNLLFDYLDTGGRFGLVNINTRNHNLVCMSGM